MDSRQSDGSGRGRFSPVNGVAAAAGAGPETVKALTVTGNGCSAGGAAEQQSAIAAQQYLAVNTRWGQYTIPAAAATAAGYHPLQSAYPTVIPQAFWGATAQSPQGGQ